MVSFSIMKLVLREEEFKSEPAQCAMIFISGLRAYLVGANTGLYVENIFTFFMITVFFYVHGFLAAYLCAKQMQFLKRPEKGARSSGTGVTGVYERPCRC